MISHQCITVGSCVSSGAIRTESQLISNVIPVSAYAAASKIASPIFGCIPWNCAAHVLSGLLISSSWNGLPSGKCVRKLRSITDS